MTPAPEFKALLISRPHAWRPALSHLRGVAIVAGLYTAVLTALALSPLILLEMMDPPRAGIRPDIPVVFPPHSGQGGTSLPGQIRPGVQSPRGTRAPSQLLAAPQNPAPQARPTLSPPPAAEETGGPGSQDGIGPAGTPGDPHGTGKDPTGT